MFLTTPKSLKLKSFGIALAMTVMVLSIAAYAMFPAKATTRQTQEEREYQIVQPDWPVGVLELVEVKNLQSESFPEDFEVVVKNIGNKPIYGIYFAVGFSRIKVGGHLRYGDARLGGSRELANPTDIPINAGELGVLKFSASEMKSIKRLIAEGFHTPADYNKILIVPQTVNFGDGTGYVINQPYPPKRGN